MPSLPLLSKVLSFQYVSTISSINKTRIFGPSSKRKKTKLKRLRFFKLLESNKTSDIYSKTLSSLCKSVHLNNKNVFYTKAQLCPTSFPLETIKQQTTYLEKGEGAL